MLLFFMYIYENQSYKAEVFYDLRIFMSRQQSKNSSVLLRKLQIFNQHFSSLKF